MPIYPKSQPKQPCLTRGSHKGHCADKKCWGQYLCIYHVKSIYYFGRYRRDGSDPDEDVELPLQGQKGGITAPTTRGRKRGQVLDIPANMEDIVQVKKECPSCSQANFKLLETCEKCGEDLVEWRP